MNNYDKEALRAYLKKLGLQPVMADIYLALHTYGGQTISELARHAKIDRIKIYRLLDELKASGLIEIEIKYKRSIIRPAPINNLQVLITKKEQELDDIKQKYPHIAAGLSQQALGSSTARVQFYEGVDGLKQMIWKQTKTEGENLSILHGNMQQKTNLAFFERWTRKCNEAEIKFRSIVGDHFIKTQQSWYKTHDNEKLEHWHGRYVSEEIFPIPYSTVIYNDTVLQYNWSEERTFGIEIESADIARVQRQFFELLWDKAESLVL